MKRKNGFTLIELLAVIVIIAIIALIATPLVLKIINNTKRSATIRSGEFYLSAVEQAIAAEMLSDSNFKATECEIKADGNLLCSELGFNTCEERNSGIICSGNEKEIKVNVKGEKPTEGIIKLNNGIVEDCKFTIGNNSLLMRENNLVFENDIEVIYEENIAAGSTVNVPDIFEYDTIYNITLSNQYVQYTEKAVFLEINGTRYLKFNGEDGIAIDGQNINVDTYIKIEKTNQKLSDYSIMLSHDTISILSKHFVPGNIEISIIDENGQILYTGADEFAEGVSGYAETFHHINNTFHTMLKENKKLYIRIEQVVDNKKVIRQYGGTTPIYQETHPYSWADDSYYWGSNFYPGTVA